MVGWVESNGLKKLLTQTQPNPRVGGLDAYPKREIPIVTWLVLLGVQCKCDSASLGHYKLYQKQPSNGSKSWQMVS